MYSIIDIETTGGMARNEKITEIAIFVFDGEKIIDEFSTLINPERAIPYNITALTGISNEMVADAPKFYEVAKKIVEITEGTTFVAHNVSFDYGFVKYEFKNLGYNFHRQKLCTVQLSRKLIPGLPSYSLGKLCVSLGINIKDRHRASGDARATVELFKKLLVANNNNPILDLESGFNLRNLNPNLDKQTVLNLPEEPGVYYFYDDADNLIYVGKSKNIHKRVHTHLSNEKSRRSIEMKSNVAHIHYECTGNELVALLLESDEIKKHKPKYNRAQRRSDMNYGLYTTFDHNGYINFRILKNADSEEVPLTTFNNQKAGKNNLHQWVADNELCQKLSGLYQSAGACFYHGLGECHGACIGKEAPEAYNFRANKIIEKLSYHHNDFFIVLKGREYREKALVKISHGKYIGFGYIDEKEINTLYTGPMDDCIKSYRDTRDTRVIIKRYVEKYKPLIIKDSE